MTERPRITQARRAGPDHQVVTVKGGSGAYRRQPCSTCPWRVDAVGIFPAEAFRHSADTAYDMARSTFACHQSGAARPAICAGFLLRGALHNMAVRIKLMEGALRLGEVSAAGLALHPSYRAMAVANGVDPADPVLARCRDDAALPDD